MFSTSGSKSFALRKLWNRSFTVDNTRPDSFSDIKKSLICWKSSVELTLGSARQSMALRIALANWAMCQPSFALVSK
jgi:hypothetical protein